MISLISRRFAPLAMPSRIRAQHIATTALLQRIYTVQSVEDFNEKVRKSKTPVVVDFFATWVQWGDFDFQDYSYQYSKCNIVRYRWCNPCKVLMPRIETVIQETNGKVDLAKVCNIIFFCGGRGKNWAHHLEESHALMAYQVKFCAEIGLHIKSNWN